MERKNQRNGERLKSVKVSSTQEGHDIGIQLVDSGYRKSEKVKKESFSLVRM